MRAETTEAAAVTKEAEGKSQEAFSSPQSRSLNTMLSIAHCRPWERAAAG